MISRKYNFILITPPKTGSTSLMFSVKDCIETSFLNNKCLCLVEPKHLHYKGYCRRENRFCMQNYIKYGTVRNPYERMVSWWKYLTSTNSPSGMRYTDNFHNFICIHVKNKNPNKIVKRTMFSYFSLGKEIKVNKFIRYERLEEDFKSFCDDVGIGKRELLHTNRTNYSFSKGETYYRSFYDEESKKIVEGIFKADLDYFGYSF